LIPYNFDYINIYVTLAIAKHPSKDKNMYTKKELINIVDNNLPLNKDHLIQYLRNNLIKTARIFLFDIFDGNKIKQEFCKTLVGLIKIGLICDYLVDVSLINNDLIVDVAMQFVQRDTQCNGCDNHVTCEIIEIGQWIFIPINIIQS